MVIHCRNREVFSTFAMRKHIISTDLYANDTPTLYITTNKQ